MLSRLNRIISSKCPSIRTARASTGKRLAFRNFASSSAQSPVEQTSIWSKYRKPIYVAIGCAFVCGAGIAWYQMTKRSDVVPYNESVAQACMQTVTSGGPGNVVYTAAQVLAEMSRSEDPAVAHALVTLGALDMCQGVLENHFDSLREGHRIQGRTVFQILRLLSNLCAFSDIADHIANDKQDTLIPLLIESGFAIENGSEDLWVQPLSHIFNFLFKSTSSPSSPLYGTRNSILELPGACTMLSTKLLPNCDPSKTEISETMTQLISTYFSTVDTSIEGLYAKLSHEATTNLGQETLDSAPLPWEGTLLEDLSNLTLVTAQLLFSSSKSASEENKSIPTALSNIGSVARLVAFREQKLLSLLEKRYFELDALDEDQDRALFAEKLLYDLNYIPWYSNAAFNPTDAQTRVFLVQREKCLETYQALLNVLPSHFTNIYTVKEAVSALLAMTTTRDEVLMYHMSTKSTWLSELLSNWILLDPTSLYSTDSPSSASKTPSNMTDEDELNEEWEVCPVNRKLLKIPETSAWGLSRAAELTTEARYDALELLARLSTVPSVASQISISRCMCSVQLDEKFRTDRFRVVLKGDSRYESSDEESVAEVEAALSVVARLRPILEIVYNVSQYAPKHVKPSDIERIVAMNPSELDSLALLSNISSTAEISDKLLKNPICSHFIFNTLSNTSKYIMSASSTTEVSRNKMEQSNQPETSQMPADALKFRLSLQAVANLAKSDPLETMNRLKASNTVPVLQQLINSRDPILKRLCVLTAAHLASVSALPPNALHARRVEGKVQLIDPKHLDGVSVLFPLSSKRPLSTVNKTPPLPTDVISSEEFDLVFIHGINGHPITTWRVENNESVAPSSVLSKIREISKHDPNEAYRLYMKYVGDPEKTAKEREAEDSICWPRDWLPFYLPKSRILTVSYDIALTRWSRGETIPLKQQAANLLEKLRLFGIGEKPVIFIAHSFGGLIVKEMLQLSSAREEYRDVLDQTRAIMFFSTPHLGSMIADLANGPADLFFRGSSAVTELFPNNWYLHHLNSAIPKIAPNVNTLSIGEIETCFLRSLSSLGADRFSCYHIVSDESANPGWKGNRHKFVKLQFNHRQVCKPEGQEDIRFQLVLDFLRQNAPKKNAQSL